MVRSSMPRLRRGKKKGGVNEIIPSTSTKTTLMHTNVYLTSIFNNTLSWEKKNAFNYAMGHKISAITHRDASSETAARKLCWRVVVFSGFQDPSLAV